MLIFRYILKYFTLILIITLLNIKILAFIILIPILDLIKLKYQISSKHYDIYQIKKN